VPIGSFWVKAALLSSSTYQPAISNLVTKKVPTEFNQDVRVRVAKGGGPSSSSTTTVPGDRPRPTRLDRRRLHNDGYYPYAQQASTSELPAGPGLKGSFNYVANSVK